MSLSQALQALTTAFVNSLIDEVRQTPIGELVGINAEAAPPARTTRQQMQNAGFERTYAPPAKAAAAPKTKLGKAERLKRRTPEQIAEAVTAVAALLKKHPDGLRSEQIRMELGLDVREVPRVLKAGIDARQIKILRGQKRATEYGVGGKASGKTVNKASASKSAPKKKAAPKKAKAVRKAVRVDHTPKKARAKKAVKAAPRKKAAPKKTPKKRAPKETSAPIPAAAE